MTVFGNLQFPVLALISSSLLFIGCGGNGGSDDDKDSGSKDAFSPSAYTEATSANEDLSGIWLMLEDYDLTYSGTYLDFETNTQIAEAYESHNRRRELFVITDTEASPTGTPRISGCDRAQHLVIDGNSVSFFDDGVNYVATLDSNTHISGSSEYESYSDASDDSPSTVQSGTFTLIKLAPLPANFEVDASSDSYGDSYTNALEPIGTMAAQGRHSDSVESFDESGSVTCFIHREGTYSESENSVETDTGSYAKFWAGAPSGFEVEIFQEKPASREGYVQIEAYMPPYSELEVDNSEFDVITGTSTMSIEGIREVSIEASIINADEGDAEASIDITLP